MLAALEMVVAEFDRKAQPPNELRRMTGLLPIHEPPGIANAREVLKQCSD